MIASPPALELAGLLGHAFGSIELLERALVHRSWAHDHTPPMPDNERLEFLGDAVLGLVIAEFFVREFREVDEGRLTRARAMVVRADSLSRYARALGLGAYIRLGRGEAEGGGRDKDNILADTFEALIGAIHEDAGLEAARAFVHRCMAADLARRDPDGGPWSPRNPRTELQERLQRDRRGTPTYDVHGRSGPDHLPAWDVTVSVGGEILGTGAGLSKKGAYEAAAMAALDALGARR